MRVAFAMSHLKGRAESWAYSLRLSDSNVFSSYDEFIQRLKSVFLPPNSDFRHRSRFLNLVQGKLTIRAYVEELRYLHACVADTASLPEVTRITVFMNGLNKGPARNELFRKYPKTFNEAVEIALSEDFSFALARGATAADPHDMEVAAIRNVNADRPGRPVNTTRCFDCGEEGHFARNCHHERAHRYGNGGRGGRGNFRPREASRGGRGGRVSFTRSQGNGRAQ